MRNRSDQRGGQGRRRQKREAPPARQNRRSQETEIHFGKPFLNGGAHIPEAALTVTRWRVSRCQLRPLRDRPRRPRQLSAFNTAADEKINGASPI